ncbi:MAG: hypothetical protein WD851_03055 [Pirellulales bacterium]
MTKRLSRLDSWCARYVLSAFASFAFLVGTSKAADVTATWDGGSGNWSDASRWILNPLGAPVVPNNTSTTFDVVINSGTVTQDFVGGVVVEDIHLAGGTLSGNGDVTATGTSSWSKGTLSGNGKTTIAAGGTLSVTPFSNSLQRTDRVLENAGELSFNQANYEWFFSNATLNNLAGVR